MRETKIEWCDHTFSPWWGCVKVSPGCANCYAEAFDRRTHGTERHTDARGVVREPHWGKDAPRRLFGDAHWRQPIAWNRAAETAGERRRVFCASMADVFEDRDDLRDARARLFELIDRTHSLDWLLLTKRPENIQRLSERAVRDIGGCVDPSERLLGENIWLGTTVENQEQADKRIPHLLRVPAAVRFLSIEPLLGPVDLSRWLRVTPLYHCSECGQEKRREDCAKCGTYGNTASNWIPSGIDWVIVGGESGPGARPCDVAWIRGVVRQCRKGGDPAEWPSGLRVREFPEVRR